MAGKWKPGAEVNLPMPLQELGPNIFYFASAVNSLVLADVAGGALLVDTGLDDSHARKLLAAVAGAGLTPVGILNTHAHADHHGGNAHILKKFPGLPVFAPPAEAAIIRQPLLEPLYLFGAVPPPELRGKFLLAPATPTVLDVWAGEQEICGVELELLPVPGHALEMYALRVGDFLFAADALFGPDSLQKHPLTFCVDSAAQKASAAALGQLEGIGLVLPGHGDPTGDLTELVAANLAAYQRTTEAVLSAAQAGPATTKGTGTDDLLARVCESLGVQMSNAGAVVLNRSVVSAHLTELQAAGRVGLRVESNQLLWAAV